jgi:hypothetical protein
MHRSSVRWFLAIGLGFALSSPAHAQFGIATLSHADGPATRLRSGAPIAASIGDSLIEGEQLATASGRAEVTFLDGAIVHLDRDTRIVLTTGATFRLLHGRASLRTSGYKEYVAETAAAKVFVPAGSLVEISVIAEADMLLQVISGAARIDTPAAGSQRVTDYHTAYVAGPGHAPIVTRMAATATDDFGRWSLTRTVMATSTALKGSEEAGGINDAAVYYPSNGNSSYGSQAYGSSSYGNSYYQTPYYGSSTYGSYYSTSYYPTSYYGSYYGSYYASPYRALSYAYYYNPSRYGYQNVYPFYRSPNYGRRGFDSPRPSNPIAGPPRGSGGGHMGRGARR